MAALFALLVLACITPSQALAKSYDMPKVAIDATVDADGDLHVTEQRTFDFDGDFTAVWWNFTNLPSGATLQIDGVRIATGTSISKSSATRLKSVPFQLKWRDAGGPGKDAYSVDDPKDTVYVFFDVSDTALTVELKYTVVDAVQAYSDVGELYWQFVGSDWAEASDNVSMNLTLPMPKGQSATAGENVRAWGHGPLNATVAINADGTVTYSVPSVKAGSYAEARVLFPSEWLTGVAAGDANAHLSSMRLDDVLDEEQMWADRANGERAFSLGTTIIGILVCLAVLIWAIRSFIRYGKELKPTFTDEYWRDEPVKGEHPAVVGRLCRFDEQSANDLTATIIHLANVGALLINRGTYLDDKGRTVEDYYLTRVPAVELSLNSEIDRKAMSLLFDTVAKGQPSLWLASIRLYAEDNPQEFSDAVEDWQGLVTSHVIAGEYFESYSTAKRLRMAVVASLLMFACVVLGAVLDNPIIVVPGVITGIAVFVVSRFMDRRTQKGADAYARCRALEKWLTEFSSLNERPTTDVKVWGMFMVYAYVFGVAEKAIEELRRAVPEVFAPDANAAYDSYVPWWVWYSTYSHQGISALPDFSSAFANSLSSSMEAVSSALSGDSSSGGGFGGGFSGGGGGGMGGGGGAR